MRPETALWRDGVQPYLSTLVHILVYHIWVRLNVWLCISTRRERDPSFLLSFFSFQTAPTSHSSIYSTSKDAFLKHIHWLPCCISSVRHSISSRQSCCRCWLTQSCQSQIEQFVGCHQSWQILNRSVFLHERAIADISQTRSLLMPKAKTLSTSERKLLDTSRKLRPPLCQQLQPSNRTLLKLQKLLVRMLQKLLRRTSTWLEDWSVTWRELLTSWSTQRFKVSRSVIALNRSLTLLRIGRPTIRTRQTWRCCIAHNQADRGFCWWGFSSTRIRSHWDRWAREEHCRWLVGWCL